MRRVADLWLFWRTSCFLGCLPRSSRSRSPRLARRMWLCPSISSVAAVGLHQYILAHIELEPCLARCNMLMRGPLALYLCQLFSALYPGRRG